MKVKVKLWGMSEIIPAFEGKGEVQVDFQGDRVKDLIFQLFLNVDPKQKDIILDDQGNISSQVDIVINGRIVSESNRFNRRLRGGDFIELILAPG